MRAFIGLAIPRVEIKPRPGGVRRHSACGCATLAFLWIATFAGTVRADEPSVEELAKLSLEQLINVEVTSVSRRLERLINAAASVYVIQADDIRRSGARTLPEALRLAPNLAVARADANQYAIAARAFNGTLANKMLVMIDGRTVYSPLFSGVFWEAQDVVLEDVARIEVISGPGGTFWGTNAVHGVIHVITRRADETLGPLASAAGGSELLRGVGRAGLRVGRNGFVRVYGQYTDQNSTRLPNGGDTGDRSNRGQGGFRADWKAGGSDLTLSGDAYTSDVRQGLSTREVRGANLTGVWARARGDGRDFRVHAYFDHTERFQPGSVRDVLNTWDVEIQHALRPATAFDLLVGAGYRYQDDRLANPVPPVLAFVPANRVLRTASLFGQGLTRIGGRGDVAVGARLEHNVYTGAEIMPSLRVGWDLIEGGRLWIEAARAVRAPSRLDRELFIPGVAPYFVAGGADFESEVANIYEVGWRHQAGQRLSYSVTAFFHDMRRLRSLRPTPGGNVLANDIEGTLAGAEAWGTWRVRPWWRLSAGIVEQRLELRTVPGRTDFSNLGALGNDPNYFGKVRTAFDLGNAVDLDFGVRHYAELRHPFVPAYTSAEARIGWWARPDLELSAVGHDLIEPRHSEWGNRTLLDRGFLLKAVWKP